jgi:ABC-2 type transport system permease protein
MTAAVQETPVQEEPRIRPTATRTFAVLMVREFRALRHKFFWTAVRIIVQPLMFVFVFSYVMPKIGAASGGGLFLASEGETTFSTIMVPGLVGSAVVMQSMITLIFPLGRDLAWPRSIEDQALAPLSLHMIALQKILSAAIQGLVSGLLIAPVVLLVHAEGQAPSVQLHNPVLLVVVLLAGALLAASTAMYLGTAVDPRQVQLMFTSLTLPAMMLGCVYFSWAMLEHVRWLQVGVLVNPLVYVNEGLRAALTPEVEHMPAWAVLCVLLLGTMTMTGLAMRSFVRRVTR